METIVITKIPGSIKADLERIIFKNTFHHLFSLASYTGDIYINTPFKGYEDLYAEVTLSTSRTPSRFTGDNLTQGDPDKVRASLSLRVFDEEGNELELSRSLIENLENELSTN